jgi:hypothetical protein
MRGRLVPWRPWYPVNRLVRRVCEGQHMPNKAIASGAGSGVGGAIAILIIALFWPHADANAAMALTVVCTAVVSTVATYLTPHGGG